MKLKQGFILGSTERVPQRKETTFRRQQTPAIASRRNHRWGGD